MVKKLISNISDLEKIKPLDEIELNSYSLPDKMFNSPQITGILGGNFDINNEKYFVVTEVGPSMRFSDGYCIKSSLYKAKEKGIDSAHVILNGHYNKARPGFNLEETIRDQVSILHNKTLFFLENN